MYTGGNDMEFTQLVEARRSIRAYKEGTQIDKEMVFDLLKIAQQAPSWKNSQTARYYAVLTPEKVAEVKAECLPEFNQNSCKDAPALIITTFEKKRAGFDREGNADNELGDEWGAYDLGLQNENLILRAKELGLDTLIMGIRDGEKLREKLAIPDSQEVVAVIALGYAAAEAAMPKRKPVEDIVKFF